MSSYRDRGRTGRTSPLPRFLGENADLEPRAEQSHAVLESRRGPFINNRRVEKALLEHEAEVPDEDVVPTRDRKSAQAQPARRAESGIRIVVPGDRLLERLPGDRESFHLATEEDVFDDSE